MDKPVAVLFTIPNFITAGSGRAMLNIIQRLDRTRFAPAVCVSRKGGTLDRVVEQIGIPFIEAPFTIPTRPYGTLLSRAWKVAQPFRPYGFRLWHSFHYLDDYTEPLIARLAGARYWVYTKKNMNWQRRSWYVRTLLASRIAAQNTDMMSDFFDHRVFRRKARLIPRSVVMHDFSPGVSEGLGLRARYQIPDDAFLIGCVAHLLPVKGHPTLLQALAQVPGAHVCLAGKPLDPEYAAVLRQMTIDLGIAERVHFLGMVHQVRAFLDDLDLFVLPTWAKWRIEGCPVALLEALASGKACIATDIPGSRDIIQHEQNGLLVPAEHAEALAQAVRRLRSSPAVRRTLGEAGKQHVLEHYAIDREVMAHEGLYGELLKV